MRGALRWVCQRLGLLFIEAQQGDFYTRKATLGYGLYWHGREVWSLIHGEFLASRWFETPEAAMAAIPQAVADLREAGRMAG